MFKKTQVVLKSAATQRKKGRGQKIYIRLSFISSALMALLIIYFQELPDLAQNKMFCFLSLPPPPILKLIIPHKSSLAATAPHHGILPLYRLNTLLFSRDLRYKMNPQHANLFSCHQSTSKNPMHKAISTFNLLLLRWQRTTARVQLCLWRGTVLHPHLQFCNLTGYLPCISCLLVHSVSHSYQFLTQLGFSLTFFIHSILLIATRPKNKTKQKQL